jgi:hypothetical protein
MMKYAKNIILVFVMTVCFFPTTLRGLEVSLTVTNREYIKKTAEPVTSGIPFAEGILTDANKVKLSRGGDEIPTQARTLATWPDGSIRWLLLDFQVDLPAFGAVPITLETDSIPTPVTGITYNNQVSSLTVNTGAATFTFDKNELKIKGEYFQVISGGATYRAVPDKDKWTVEESGPLKLVIRVEGNWLNGGSRLGNSLVTFRARLIFFKNKSGMRVLFTFKNNNSFGWDSSKGQSITLSGVNFGVHLLPQGGSYVFGQGVEKTWEIDVPAIGNPVNRDTRYTASGTVADGYTAPRALAVASPPYYASTRAWGQIQLPLTGFNSVSQPDFDLFEKLQRAKVTPADVENPPGLQGNTLWKHLYQDIQSWNNYGDLRWGGDCGPFSGNHYDWVYGMILQFMRTGRYAFLDAARVFAKHEIDFDIYHTNADGSAFNYQENWESRLSHNSPDNCFGGGRPSHTWGQGYALYWLLTGDPRAKDAIDEIIEGVRQYIYESFNNFGYINTNEIRIQGWLVDNLVTQWRIDPTTTFQTADYGTKTLPQAVKDVLKSVLDLEIKAGKHGYVYDGDPPRSNLSAPLMHCYFLGPAINAYSEVFKGRDSSYAGELSGLIFRMSSWLMGVTYGGETNGSGHYLPRQIPYIVDRHLSQQTDGQIPYLLMTADAVGFCMLETGDYVLNRERLRYMRPAFQDYIRYLGVVAGDTYVENTSARTAASYNSNIYVDSESKIHGWSNRYGQYYLAAELLYENPKLTLINPNGGETWQIGSSHQISWMNTRNIEYVKIEFSSDNGGHWTTVTASTSNTGVYNWTVPSVASDGCRIRIKSAADSNITDMSDSVFKIEAATYPTIQLSKNKLKFGAVTGGVATGPQHILISSSTGGQLTWSASSSDQWLTVSPASGTGNAFIEISIDPAGLSLGTYTGAITITDPHATNSPQAIQVTLDYTGAGVAPFGAFETPVDNASVMSSIPVTGWALDDVEVTMVKILREPVTTGEGTDLIYIGDAVLVEGMRPDVEQTYVDYPFNYRAGWGYMLLTYGLPGKGMNNTYRIHAIAYDRENNSVKLGVKTINCENGRAVKPFGAIDTPLQGGAASGSDFVNWGWVLTPQPNHIATDGSTIQVIVDGVNLGHPVYDVYRQDIADLFPGYANSEGAVGYFNLDAAQYENGVHTIAWTAVDNAGNADGIGSRYFIIRDPGAGDELGVRGQGSGVSRGAPACAPVFDSCSPVFDRVASEPDQYGRQSVGVIKGYKKNAAPQMVYPDENGIITVEIKELERLEIHFPASPVNSLSPLPVGSTLDKGRGIFYWQPGPGFRGVYEFVFLNKVKKVLQVIIK